MKEDQHTFTKISQRIADDFLSTIVFIDECAYKQAPENDNDFDAKAVTETFAKKGKICSVFAPEKASDLDNICSVLFKADAVVLDWRLNIEDDNAKSSTDLETDVDTDDERGKYTIPIIQKIINDAGSEKVKLIVVYTGETDLKQIGMDIAKSLNIESGAFEIACHNVKIVIRAKSTKSAESGKYKYLDDEYKQQVIDYSQLPDLIVEQFSAMVNGILPNFALQTITEIRNSTSKILGVFSRDLDPAFLGHCSLTSIDDGAEVLSEVFGTAITELINASPIDLNELINQWINMLPLESQEIIIKERINNNGNEKGIDVPIEVTPTLLFEITKGALTEKALKEKTNNFKIFDKSKKQFANKKAQQHVTDFFCRNNEDGNLSNLTFAQLTQNRNLFSIKSVVPELTQGAILKDEQGRYWLCVSPACDCARISKNGKNFIFVPINKEAADGSPIVLDQNVIKGVDIHPYSINMWRFSSKEENKPVKAENDNETYVFTDAEGNKYQWVLTLKRLYAQRITEKLSSQMSRVGVNVSEWLRRMGKDSD